MTSHTNPKSVRFFFEWAYGVGGCLLAGLKIQRPLFNSKCAHKCGSGGMVDTPV